MGHHPEEDPPPFTAIEFPTLLYLSPYRNARWRQRPSTGARRSELWGLELARPPAETSPGAPRSVRASGHLFAFAWRSVDEATWPKAVGGGKPGADSDKYSADERPKTSLYEATSSRLVKQLSEDNGDITAQRFRLTSLGTTARLHYRPAFEPGGDKPSNNEGVKPEDDGEQARRERLRSAFNLLRIPCENTPLRERAEAAIGNTACCPLVEAFVLLRKELADLKLSEERWKIIGAVFKSTTVAANDQGFLLEWIQKTEIGRDFYTKEAFAGYWMPFGFKAEVVTITERLPCSDRVVPVADSDDIVGLESQESRLTAFLVARKFARVRLWRNGTLKREFSSTESADFVPWLGQAGRTAGLLSVEILQDRTPVLANKARDIFTEKIGSTVSLTDYLMAALPDERMLRQRLHWLID